MLPTALGDTFFLFQICNIMNTSTDEMFKFQVSTHSPHRLCALLGKESIVVHKSWAELDFDFKEQLLMMRKLYSCSWVCRWAVFHGGSAGPVWA